MNSLNISLLRDMGVAKAVLLEPSGVIEPHVGFWQYGGIWSKIESER